MTKILQFFGEFFAGTIPRCRLKRIPVSIAWFAYAVVYFRDFVAPKKRYRPADDVERGVLEQLSSRLAQLPPEVSADQIQHSLYDIARPIPRYQDHSAKGATAARPGVSNEFFNMVYAILLGENRGPRLGSFIAIYGLDETRKLIHKALAGELVGKAGA